MLFVPNKSDCQIWFKRDDGTIFIRWAFNNKFPICFIWGKKPILNELTNKIEYEETDDPFYLEVIGCMDDEVLKCPEAACSSFPQLRYNKILNKWFCNCPSSAICTKNTDNDELEELLQFDIKNKKNK